jgi:hypothetical protein
VALVMSYQQNVRNLNAVEKSAIAFIQQACSEARDREGAGGNRLALEEDAAPEASARDA